MLDWLKPNWLKGRDEPPVDAPPSEDEAEESEQDDAEIIRAAKDFLSLSADFQDSYIPQCREAIRFIRHNDQWTDAAKRAREVPGQERIMLTFNRLREYSRQVVNGIRQNTPSIKVRPIGSGADEPTAEIFDGIIRQIQRHSKADAAYEESAGWAVDGGFGYLTILPEFLSDDSFDMVPVIRVVPDPFRVYFDPQSVESDGSDAEEAMIERIMDRAEFDRAYPDYKDKSVQDFDGDVDADSASEWYGEDSVVLADYFRIEYRDDTLYQYQDGSTGWKSEFIERSPLYPIKERQVKRKSCVWYKIGGNQIFDRQDLKIPWVPVVPVYGDMWIYEGRRHVEGLTQNAMDAQRAYNYARTTEVELVSLARQLPRTIPAESVAGFENYWATANTSNHAYLPYNALTEDGRLLPAPGQDQFPQVPTALVQMSREALDDLKGTAGIPDPGRGASEGANQSGIAVARLQNQAVQGTSHFGQNLARSVEHIGRILIKWIPQLYTTDQVIHILAEDDTQKAVRITPNLAGPQGQAIASQEYRDAQGKIQRAFRLDVGNYNVMAQVGPAYSSRKQEAAEWMMQLTQAVPQAMAPALPKIIRLQDNPGSDDIADAVERGLPPQLRDPGDDDQAKIMQHPAVQQLQQQVQQLTQQVLPQMLQAMQQAQQEAQQAKAEAQNKQGDVALKAAELKLKEREIGIKEMDAQLKFIQAQAAAQAAQQPQQPQPAPVDPRAEKLADMDLDRQQLAILKDVHAMNRALLDEERAEKEREMAESTEEETYE